MQSQKTVVAFLLDRSGSMESIRDDTIGAFNAYLDGLKGTEDLIFSLLTFDSISIDKVYANQPIDVVEKLTRETFVPRASTPLIDAAVKTIRAVEKSVGDSDAKVVICIQTDGQENSSKEFTWDELNQLIKEKSALGWQFNFMGAGIDAYEQGRRMGISAVNTVSYDSSDRISTQSTFVATAHNLRSYAKGESATTAYDTHQKAAAGDQFVPAADALAAKPTVTPTVRVTSRAKKPGIVDDIVL